MISFDATTIATAITTILSSSLYAVNAKFDAGIIYNYTGKKFSNDANSIELDAIGLASLNLGYTFDLGENGETMRIGSQVFNLFNSDGITEGSPRLNNNQTEEEFFVGRPVLPTRVFLTSPPLKKEKKKEERKRRSS